MNTQTIEHNPKEGTIGRLLLDSGKLTKSQVQEVAKLQKDRKIRFGDAAVLLGLIEESDILQAISRQFDYTCLPDNDESVSSSIITAFRTGGKDVEVLRAIRSQLLLRWFIENKSLVVTAPHAEAGASYVAANLAVMFSQLGKKTLLIDGDMRFPVQQSNFLAPGKLGLSDLLANRVGLEVIYGVGSLDNLFVLPAGTIPPNPDELIGHGRFLSLHKQLSSNYDVIVIDSPPILEFSEAQALLSVTKGGVIVAKKNVTELAEISKVKEQFSVAASMAVGVVLNN